MSKYQDPNSDMSKVKILTSQQWNIKISRSKQRHTCIKISRSSQWQINIFPNTTFSFLYKTDLNRVCLLCYIHVTYILIGALFRHSFFFCWCHNCLTALCYDWKRLLFYNIFKKIMTTWQAFMLITYCKMLNRKNILSLPISMKDKIILWHQQNNGKKT